MRQPATFGLSVVAHLGLVAFGIGYSYWHVPELEPPRIAMLIAPPPPPPPGSGPAPRARARATPARVRNQIPTPQLQPEETPRVPNADHTPAPVITTGQESGPEGDGDGHGTGHGPGLDSGGGVGDGPGAPVPAPAVRTVPPQIGQARFLGGPMPQTPEALRRLGIGRAVLTKVCVDVEGVVERVTILAGAEASLDEAVVTALRQWRYRPYLIDGRPVPFCTTVRLSFETTGP